DFGSCAVDSHPQHTAGLPSMESVDQLMVGVVGWIRPSRSEANEQLGFDGGRYRTEAERRTSDEAFVLGLDRHRDPADIEFHVYRRHRDIKADGSAGRADARSYRFAMTTGPEPSS